MFIRLTSTDVDIKEHTYVNVNLIQTFGFMYRRIDASFVSFTSDEIITVTETPEQIMKLIMEQS